MNTDMTTRRKFIGEIAAGALIAGAFPQLAFGKIQSHKLRNIGFISNLLNNEFENGDWKALLGEAVKLGFTEYEGGIKGNSPEEFKSYCTEIGLKHVAGGLGMTEDMDEAKKKLDELKFLGVSYAIIYWPWFVGAPFKLEDCKKSAPILNKIGDLAKERKLQLCWHNHDKEFSAMENGQLPYDYLMENTDSDLVKVEMDIYWVGKGGADPIDLMRKYPGSVKIMHVKDMAEGQDQDFACPGRGIIDFAPIFAEARKQKIKHYFVERDKIVDGMACLQDSSKFLQSLRF
jgi:sugar phosphate isomerase/epimerase